MLVLHCFHGVTSVPKAMSHILSLHFTSHIDCFTVFVSLFLLLVQTCRRLYECCFISVFSSRIHILHYFVGIAFYILDAAAVAAPFLKAEQIDKGKIKVNLLVNFIYEGKKICYYCNAPINVKPGKAGCGVLKENLKSFFFNYCTWYLHSGCLLMRTVWWMWCMVYLSLRPSSHEIWASPCNMAKFLWPIISDHISRVPLYLKMFISEPCVKKHSNTPSPGRARSVKYPTPGPTKTIRSPCHASPLPPAGITLIGA